MKEARNSWTRRSKECRLFVNLMRKKNRQVMFRLISIEDYTKATRCGIREAQKSQTTPQIVLRRFGDPVTEKRRASY